GKHSTIVYACDCSTEALDRAKEIIETADGVSAQHRFCPFVCDFSVNEFPNWLTCNTCRRTSMKQLVDCETGSLLLICQLSFDSKANHQSFLFVVVSDTDARCLTQDFGKRCCMTSCLYLQVPTDLFTCVVHDCLFVDTANSVVSLTYICKLHCKGKRIGLREYMRSDGILCYFFCLETVRELFVAAGFIELELDYCCINSVNRRNGKSMRRVWVHGKFQKPI
ncbi:hypothetical protein MKX01_015522, partial [Papaver californicum]